MAKEVVTDLYRDKPKNNKKLKMSLPLPVSVNALYIGRRHNLSKEAQNYVRVSRSLINLAIEEQCWLMQGKSVWFYIDLVFFMPDRIVRDSHNMLKLLLDVLQGLAYQNDYYVLPRIQTVEYDPINPRVDLLIKPQTENERIQGLQIVR